MIANINTEGCHEASHFTIFSGSVYPYRRCICYSDNSRGDNALASFVLTQHRVGLGGEEFIVDVSAREAKNLRGYGFVLQYDPLQYQFISTEKTNESLFNTSGDPAIFFSNNRRGL